MADMYICPNAKFCTRKAFIKSRLNHCREHEKDSACEKEVKYCPPCIPLPSEESMREKIAEIVWNISTSHWGQETTMDFREQQRKKFVSELEALFTASQFELKTESDARLELIKRMLEKMEQMQTKAQAMREALHRIYELIDINRPYCDRCDDIRDIVMKFEGGR